MSKEEIRELVSRQFLCRVAFVRGKYPHILPLQYVLLNNSLYFHFSEYGQKMKLLESRTNVCAEIEEYEPDLSQFKFVILRGKLEKVTDSLERKEAIDRMAEQGRRMLSKNFLAAHGFRKEDDWSSFTSTEPLMIAKLTPTTESGLRSP